MIKPFTQFLEAANTSEKRARFFQTLSYLEYLGARRIMKTLSSDVMNAQLLAHLSEEVRHAQSLKRLAIRFGGDPKSTYEERHLLCKQAATDYFRSIDQLLIDAVPDGDAHILYVATTWIVEQRACQVYPLIAKHWLSNDVTSTIKAILRDEATHLDEMRELISPYGFANAGQLQSAENTLFLKFSFSLLEQFTGAHSRTSPRKYM